MIIYSHVDPNSQCWGERNEQALLKFYWLVVSWKAATQILSNRKRRKFGRSLTNRNKKTKLRGFEISSSIWLGKLLLAVCHPAPSSLRSRPLIVTHFYSKQNEQDGSHNYWIHMNTQYMYSIWCQTQSWFDASDASALSGNWVWSCTFSTFARFGCGFAAPSKKGCSQLRFEI